MKNQVIDFVITWVDGSDPIWFQEKQKIFKKAVGAVLFENFAQAGTFPYRPFCLGVAVVSQILCISTTLNKRKATEFLILFFATLIHYRKIRHSSRGNKRI